MGLSQQITVVITKADGTTQLLEAYEDINLSSNEYPHYILFSQDGDVIEVHLEADDIFHTWYFDEAPITDDLLDILFTEPMDLDIDLPSDYYDYYDYYEDFE